MFALFVFDDVLDTAIQKFDVVSFLLSAFAFGGITLGIGNISSVGLFQIGSCLPLFVGIIASVIFVRRQLHLETAFLDLRVLKYKDYALSILSSILLYFIMMGASILMPLYIQSILDCSATICGLALLPGSLLMAIISPFAGKIYDKFGIRNLFIAGALCLIISNLGMVFLTIESSLWFSIVYNVIRNIAIGCLLMPFVTWGISSLRQTETAHGTALLNALRTIAGAIGSAVSVGLMTTVAAQLSGTQQASMFGLNISFLMLTLISVLLLGMALFFVKAKE